MGIFKKNKTDEAHQLRARSLGENPSAPSAFSYHSSRSNRLDSSSDKNRAAIMEAGEGESKSDYRSKRRLVLLILLASLVLVFFVTRVSTAAQVTIVQPPGFNYMPHTLNQYQIASAHAIGSSLYSQNKLTLNSNNIANYLEKRYPEIEYVAVTVPLIGSTPTVHIQLVSPALVYSTSQNSYILDSNGNIIGPSSILSQKQIAQLPAVEYGVNESFSNGMQVVSNNNVLFVRIVKTALQSKNIQINKMVLVPEAEELDVYPKGQPYYIKFNLHQTDALQQVGTYLAAIATLKSKNQTPKQYIDVRVDGRAYYK